MLVVKLYTVALGGVEIPDFFVHYLTQVERDRW